MDDKFQLEFNRRLCALVLRLIRFVDSFPGDGDGRGAGDRLLKSGTRILANYTESRSACSPKDFADCLNHSLESVNESILWVSVLKNGQDNHKPEAERLTQELREIGDILGASIKNIKGKK